MLFTMKIVEKDFVLVSNGGLFDLYFLKNVKNKETGELEKKVFRGAYGCNLASALKRIVKHRRNTAFESESPCLLEYLEKTIELENEIIHLCKETIPEDFDTGE